MSLLMIDLSLFVSYNKKCMNLPTAFAAVDKVEEEKAYADRQRNGGRNEEIGTALRRQSKEGIFDR